MPSTDLPPFSVPDPPDDLELFPAWLDAQIERLRQHTIDGLRRIVLEAYDAFLSTLTAAGNPTVFDAIPAQWESFVNGALLDGYVGMYISGSISAYVTSPISQIAEPVARQAWAKIVNDNALAYQAQAQNRLVNVGQNVWQSVKGSTIDAIATGKSNDELSSMIQQMTGFAEHRADAIARTETVTAYNAGNFEGQKALGDYGPVAKEWLATGDARTRPSHLAAMEQGAIPIDATFTVGDAEMLYPGDDGPPEEVVNCRCTVLYYFPGDEALNGEPIEGPDIFENAADEEETTATLAAGQTEGSDTMPFAGYENFDECVADNQNRRDPERFCGWLEARAEAETIRRQEAKLALALEPALVDEPTIDEPQPDPELDPMIEDDTQVDSEDFHALLVVEDIWTGDGRFLEEGSLGWRELPLPLMGTDRTTTGHDSAILIGTFTRLERLGREIHGWGSFVESDEPEVMRLQKLITTGKLRGISVDLDSVEYEVVVSDPMPEVSPDGRLPGENAQMIVTSARIMGATVVPFPAFAEAFIESRALLASAIGTSNELTGFLEAWSSVDSVDLTPPQGAREEAQRGLDWRSEHGRGGTAVGIARARDIANGKRLSPDTIGRMLSYFARHEVDKQGTGWSPGEDGYPSNGRIAWALWGGDAGWAFARAAQESIDARRAEGSITASLATLEVPVCPPAEWFDDPALSGPSPITVTDDGRIFGHIATWGTCHIGFTGRCVTPPRSATSYAWFRTGEILCDDGSRVSVGQITVDTGHAAHNLSARPAAAHYDHTGSAVADVAVGEDEHGIWCSGSIRPGITPDHLRVLMASDVSGDWRLVGGSMELVAVLSVNVPGFPKRRLSIAEREGQMTSMFASAAIERTSVDALVERIASSIGRSKTQRIGELTARVKGGR